MIFCESAFGKILMTFVMAMAPVVELRGAIPLGVAAGLPPALAAVTAMLGNLVPVPLPGTGAWTGALVADVLDIRMKTALPAIAVGVIIAGCVTTAVTCGVVSFF